MELIKRKGKYKDNLKEKTTGEKVIFTEENAKKMGAFLTKLSLKEGIGRGKIGSTSAKCLDYYFGGYLARPKIRSYFGGTKILGLDRKKIINIVKKHYGSKAFLSDYLVFNGYNFLIRGDVANYTEKIKQTLKKNVIWAVKNNISTKKILKFYDYNHIPQIHRNKSKLSENDFWFAIGDNNYLYGQVHTINLKKKEFEILFVLYDEYNWDNNVTYFIKHKYITLIIETGVFKYLESNNMAKEFITCFADTEVVKF